MTVLNQVRKTIAQHQLIRREETIVLGISGGPDSLALAHLLRALRDERPFQIHLAHLNHQLRGAESDADAEFVRALARDWNLPTTIEARAVAAYAHEKKLSVEEAARELRYAFLSEVAQKVGARTIAVAHHADDQAETVLMHFLRGAGMRGLRGMSYEWPIENSRLRIVRPLLDVTRAEIETYCQENGLMPRIDKSNLDPTLFRNRLRHQVLPYLETLNPRLRTILLHMSRSLADDYDLIESQAGEAYAHVTREEDGTVIFSRGAWRALHPSIQRATLRRAFERLRGDYRNLDWTHIEEARTVALEKGAGAEATLPRGLKLTLGYENFFIAEATREFTLDLPQLNVECIELPREGLVKLPESSWMVEVSKSTADHGNEQATGNWHAAFDAEACHGQLALRRRQPGDRFQPAGMGGHTKSLHEFMIDEKIPRAARARLPILCDREKILWVCGYRLDERARVTDKTREIFEVTLQKQADA